MGNRSQRLRSNTMCVKHKWTRVIAAKPSCSIFFEANGRNRTKLFALLNLIQPHSGASWNGEARIERFPNARGPISYFPFTHPMIRLLANMSAIIS